MSESSRNGAWTVDAADFPVGGDVSDLLRFALRYAVLAPSSHNSQPWLYRLDGGAVEVYADRTRRLPVVDPDDRQLVMSCGAALCNLRITLRHLNADVEVSVLPNGQNSALLARVEASARLCAPDAGADQLFTAITARHTTRTAFEDTPVAAALVAQMGQAASVERAELVEVSPSQRAAVTRLVGDADRAQMSQSRFRREHWMRANQPASDDGMPGYAFGRSELESVVGPLVVRTFDVGNGQAARDEDLSRGSALLAVLATEYDDVTSWMAAGQAMQRALLTATAAGLKTSFLNQPIEVPSLRRQLARTLGLPGQPQLLLRFGYGTGGAPTPRRQISDVLRANRPA